MKLKELEASVFIDIFRFSNNRFWAFKQMILGPRAIANVKGLGFYRFLGTGGGMGFSLRPDFGTYAVLTQWDNSEDYKKFIMTNSYWDRYRRHASQQRTLQLVPIQSHGKWNKSNPFLTSIVKDLEIGDAHVAIITRATINWNRLFSFWRAVPNSAKSIEAATVVLYYKGMESGLGCNKPPSVFGKILMLSMPMLIRIEIMQILFGKLDLKNGTKKIFFLDLL